MQVAHALAQARRGPRTEFAEALWASLPDAREGAKWIDTSWFEPDATVLSDEELAAIVGPKFITFHSTLTVDEMQEHAAGGSLAAKYEAWLTQQEEQNVS